MRLVAVLALVLSAVVATGAAAHGASAALALPPDVRKVHAVAVAGDRAYLATGANRAELVVFDLDSVAVLGRFDAAGTADALSVKVVGPGVVKLGRRRSGAPEVYLLDVRDPASIVVLESGERARSVRWKQEALPPVRFADANGDGVFRLACLGDSNTAHPPASPFGKWCEMLDDEIADPRFESVNVAEGGATVIENRRGGPDARAQLALVVDAGVDAIVLSFGTNDRLQGARPEEIRDAYRDHVDVAELAGLAAYVATTPPTGRCVDLGCPLIADANVLLHEAFADRTIDFFADVGRAYMSDALHFNAAGQALRARRAAERLIFPQLR